ncbi:MAG: PD40 domain-containing protein [Acidobacteriia bacterium]|nr:PD40 domain-containing protein [Terriglobia bacterium]
MIGTTLAHYRITAKLGEGGMGEVYRATDLKLNREVAIKVLPESFAQDPDRMARFQREAHVLASLNHPNIAAIYGLEDRALVLELVEGETLAGPLPIGTALHYARQITDALEAAHEKGIIHRDLKPANIKITPAGQVKVLDFGLAKAVEQSAPSGNPDLSPTMTAAATRLGVIMGTAAYMAPEQARGQHVDKRIDIWSFGVVLFEMLTGKRLFTGETISDTLAAVLKSDIDLSQSPQSVRKLLDRCLQRDRKLRLRDISDAWAHIEDAPAAAITAAPARRILPWAITAMVTLAAAGLWQTTRPVERPLIQIEADLGPGVSLATLNFNPVILSPDGMRIAFTSAGAVGGSHLYTRRLNQPKAVLLAGTEGVASPFFSPDGQWIAFFADGKLKKVQVEGGAAMTLCEAGGVLGGDWGEDGNIIAALGTRSVLSLIPSAGGAPKPVTTFTKGEVTHRWPQILPGGKAVLFISHTTGGNYDEAAIEVLSVPDGRRKKLHQGASWSRYVSSGHLLYLFKGTLFAMPFHLGRLETTGPAFPVLEGVASRGISGVALFDVSPAGTAVYQSGGAEGNLVSIQWMDQSGKTEPLLAKQGDYIMPRFSPDGKRLALVSAQGGDRGIWTYDWSRDAMNRLTFDPGSEVYPVWTPDEKYIFYRNAGSTISWVPSDGASKPVELFTGYKEIQTPHSITTDGKRLAFIQADDIWTVPLEGGSGPPRAGKPEVFVKTTFLESWPAFSPDGKWIAYSSFESGTYEVFVRAFPDSGGKWLISNNGGTTPVWSRTGNELYYRTMDYRITAAPYSVNGGSFVPGKPRLWSEKRFPAGLQFGSYDLHPDGKRFAVLMGPEVEEKPRSQVTFLFNFLDELKRRVPPGGGK